MHFATHSFGPGSFPSSPCFPLGTPWAVPFRGPKPTQEAQWLGLGCRGRRGRGDLAPGQRGDRAGEVETADGEARRWKKDRMV